MKIRTQNLLTIVPIFMAMGIILGFLKYTSERQELLWGVEEEISSLALSIVEFMTFEDVKKARAGQKILSISKLEKWNISSSKENSLGNGYNIKNLYLLILKRKEKIELVNIINEKSLDNISQDQVDLLRVPETKQKAYNLSNIKYDSKGKAYLSAFVPLSFTIPSLGQLYLGIDTDIDYYDKHLEKLLLSIIYFIIGISFLGLLSTFFFSHLFTQRIKTLIQAAKKITLGYYGQPVQIGTIQEIGDLSNTFNTMSSILQEVLSKTQEELVVGERFLGEQDLTLQFQKLNFKPIDLNLGSISVSARFLGKQGKGDFYGSFEVQNKVYIVLGQLSDTEVDLHTSLTAFSAYSVFKKLLSSTNDSKLSFSRGFELFDVNTLHCLCLDKESKNKEIIHTQWYKSKLTQQNHKLTADSTLIFNTLSPTADENIDMIVKTFSKVPVTNLMSRLEKSLSRQSYEGCIALIRCNS